MEKEDKKTEEKSSISEHIKKRPINKKKLFRKTVFTIVMAVIFGAIACVTFLLLEPVISDRLAPEEEIVRVELPEIKDEVAPEQLLTEDNLEQAAIDEESKRRVEMENEVTRYIVEDAIDEELTMKAYEIIYDELYKIATEASRSLVTVTGVSQETDWFLNEVENINETSGVIVAINEQAAYIVADLNGLPDADTYSVIFQNGTEVDGELRGSDPNTGLAVFSVPVSELPTEESTSPKAINFAGSVTAMIVGRPIIAVGSPLGQSGSVCYGIITSNRKQIVYADHAYDILTTDITGSETNASGILINTSGQLLGIITKETASSTSGPLLAGFGISGLRGLIEKLSNNDARVYLGIHGADVTQSINKTRGVPMGLYVTEVDVGSPAIEGGVVNGDVVVNLNGKEITGRASYEEAISSLTPDEEVSISVMRFNGTEYTQIDGTVTVGGFE